MVHKKQQTPWFLIIVGGASLAFGGWYFFSGNRHSTMDTMQHPAANLTPEQPTEVTADVQPETPAIMHITVCEVTDPTQLETLAKSTRPAVIKFYAPWCGACNHVASYYGDIANDCGKEVDFYSVNLDTPGLMDEANKLNLVKEPIQYLPTFVFFQAGKVHEQKVGALSKEELTKQIKSVFSL